jgi:hypothetical protein
MWPRFAILAALLVFGLPSQSTASVPESLDSATPPARSVTVQVDGDSTLTVARVEPSSLGFVRVIHTDGSEEYVANHKIRWIRDAEGRDRTSQILDRGKSLGDAPVSIRYAAQRRARTLRGSPLSVRKSFPIVQAGLLARLDRDQAHPSDHPVSLVIDVGAMKNVTKHWGVGGSFFFAGDEDFSRLGAKVRFRRWLGSSVAIDAAPGLLFAKDIDLNQGPFHPGFVGELGISLGDWMSVTAQMEAARREHRFYSFNPTPPYGYYERPRRSENTEVSWYLGGKFGGEAAIVAFFGTLLLGMVMVSGPL